MRQIRNLLLISFFILVIEACTEDELPISTRLNSDNSQNTPGWYFSSILTNNRYIYVRLPEDYNPDEAEVYHTVYLLDANWYFDGTHERIGGGGIAGTIDRMVSQELINDVILIGIGNLNTYGLFLDAFWFLPLN